jgi:hypothetical protein
VLIEQISNKEQGISNGEGQKDTGGTTPPGTPRDPSYFASAFDIPCSLLEIFCNRDAYLGARNVQFAWA